jgi:hypothetical protein
MAVAQRTGEQAARDYSIGKVTSLAQGSSEFGDGGDAALHEGAGGAPPSLFGGSIA